jgi:hypothetical protein
VEIDLVPDPGSDDPVADAARTALARELEGRRDGAGWELVPHSEAWRRAAVRDAVARTDGLEDDGGSRAGGGAASRTGLAAGQARPVRSTRGATRA